MVENPPASTGDMGSISRSGKSPGEGNSNPLQYSCLENLMDTGAWWATVYRIAKESDTTEQLKINNLLQGTHRGSVQFIAQSCPTLCNPMDCSPPGFPVLHQLPELTQTHVHRVSNGIQPPYHLSSPSPPAFNLSQRQGLFQ